MLDLLEAAGVEQPPSGVQHAVSEDWFRSLTGHIAELCCSSQKDIRTFVHLYIELLPK